MGIMDMGAMSVQLSVSGFHVWEPVHCGTSDLSLPTNLSPLLGVLALPFGAAVFLQPNSGTMSKRRETAFKLSQGIRTESIIPSSHHDIGRFWLSESSCKLYKCQRPEPGICIGYGYGHKRKTMNIIADDMKRVCCPNAQQGCHAKI
jgi:hypothetical protein